MFELSEYEKLETAFFYKLYFKFDLILINNGVRNKCARERICKEAIETVGSHLDENEVDIDFILDGVNHKYSEGYMMCHHDNASEAVISAELPEAEETCESLYEVYKNRLNNGVDVSAH